MPAQPEKLFVLSHRLDAIKGLALVVSLAMGFSGCVSKSKAEAQARMAYLAGQRDALMQLQQQQHHGPTVTFLGPVTNPVVDWSADLTLTQGILKAVFNGPADPASITIHRSGQDIQTAPGLLLEGKDLPLQPGDVVEIH